MIISATVSTDILHMNWWN